MCVFTFFLLVLSVCVTNGGPRPGESCVFPYQINGAWYESCIPLYNEHVSGDWCGVVSNLQASQATLSAWGSCASDDADCYPGK